VQHAAYNASISLECLLEISNALGITCHPQGHGWWLVVVMVVHPRPPRGGHSLPLRAHKLHVWHCQAAHRSDIVLQHDAGMTEHISIKLFPSIVGRGGKKEGELLVPIIQRELHLMAAIMPDPNT
jgi:hypothetical protein